MQPIQQDLDRFANPRPLAVANTFVARVYNWMGVGLGVTAAVALLISQSETLVRTIFGNPIILIGLVIAQLGTVFAISASARRANPALATMLFLAYAALLGLTMSVILLVYTASSVAGTFLVTAGMFGGMSVYGWTTKKDLTSIGSFLIMAVWGLILASIVNIFLRSSGMSWLISIAGVAIFVGLTAYDTQKIKRIGASVDGDSAEGRGLAIQGALALYLDFVNMFMFMLRLLGSRR